MFQRNQANAQKLYAWLRREVGIRDVTLTELAQEFGCPRPAVSRAIDTLVRLGLIERTQDFNSVVIQVRTTRAFKGAPAGLRGHSSVSVVPASDALVSAMQPDEAEQLFLALHDSPEVAAVYRYLREKLKTEVTYKEMAGRFTCKSETIRKRVNRLVELGLVAVVHKTASLIVSFCDLEASGSVDQEELRDWLGGPAAVPTDSAANHARILRTDSKGIQADVVLDFFNKATAAKGSKNDTGMAYPGAKVANERVARNLVREHTFKQLMGPLLFFVVDWAGEAVDNYGRTLMTFQKNLPVILEEYGDNARTDRTYIQRLMKRMGLDAHFPVPEVKQPVKPAPMIEDDDDDDDEVVPAPVRRPRTVLTPEERRAQRRAFAKALSYG